eukprot:87339_1
MGCSGSVHLEITAEADMSRPLYCGVSFTNLKIHIKRITGPATHGKVKSRIDQEESKIRRLLDDFGSDFSNKLRRQFTVEELSFVGSKSIKRMVKKLWKPEDLYCYFKSDDHLYGDLRITEHMTPVYKVDIRYDPNDPFPTFFDPIFKPISNGVSWIICQFSKQAREKKRKKNEEQKQVDDMWENKGDQHVQITTKKVISLFGEKNEDIPTPYVTNNYKNKRVSYKIVTDAGNWSINRQLDSIKHKCGICYYESSPTWKYVQTDLSKTLPPDLEVNYETSVFVKTNTFLGIFQDGVTLKCEIKVDIKKKIFDVNIKGIQGLLNDLKSKAEREVEQNIDNCRECDVCIWTCGSKIKVNARVRIGYSA